MSLIGTRANSYDLVLLRELPIRMTMTVALARFAQTDATEVSEWDGASVLWVEIAILLRSMNPEFDVKMHLSTCCRSEPRFRE
jgi:hypothetical protein